ncbi:biotin synthase BioB [Streptococcus agalactiae]|uniref:biotin synthase BioB n=1 Tax=Streptococcus agalactiae TaxID=1311 RepID=UPI000B720F28|nr:biotin synthase BioB [Streptococcus agalactiae]OTG59048.1 biotin synthase BioB [Streptococcus agalactiae]RRA75585.1 biotin synthase BioB [Streptococcus agalactiae]
MSFQTNYIHLADEILSGKTSISYEQALEILNSDENWWEIYAAALYLKNQVSRNNIRLNVLLSAKQGLCAENCGYCSQSKESTADIDKFGLLPQNVILKQAIVAHQNGASVFCIAMSGTKPSKREIEQLCQVIPEIKKSLPLEICLTAGFLDREQLHQLKQAGIDRINHNLNTPEEHYPNIATTHSFKDRCDTLERIHNEDIDVCSGFICGMGESDEGLITLAFRLKELNPYSIPVNFLLAVEGTPLGKYNYLTPIKCLKIMAMLRFVFPFKELRLSAGREVHFENFESLVTLLVDSTFLGNYLTEGGRNQHTDIEFLEKLQLNHTKKELI